MLYTISLLLWWWSLCVAFSEAEVIPSSSYDDGVPAEKKKASPYDIDRDREPYEMGIHHGGAPEFLKLIDVTASGFNPYITSPIKPIFHDGVNGDGGGIGFNGGSDEEVEGWVKVYYDHQATVGDMVQRARKKAKDFKDGKSEKKSKRKSAKSSKKEQKSKKNDKYGPTGPPSMSPTLVVPGKSLRTFCSGETALINEIRYQNAGIDVNEFVEVVASPRYDRFLVLFFYEGETGLFYKRMSLDNTDSVTKTIVNNSDGDDGLVYWVVRTRLRNTEGSGVALVEGRTASANETTTVLEFVSYGNRAVTAVDGPAAGLTSLNLGLSQDPNGDTDTSLQRRTVWGNSSSSTTTESSVWVLGEPSTPGEPNPNATLFCENDGGGVGDANVTVAVAPSFLPSSTMTLVQGPTSTVVPATAEPTAEPSSITTLGDPTLVPQTVKPTESVTATLTMEPTDALTELPSQLPTLELTEMPTGDLTLNPTEDPTKEPSTNLPTTAPTIVPTGDPTNEPTVAPTIVPTGDPTNEPTVAPTIVHTGDPTNEPTVAPTLVPTGDPTNEPTVAPTLVPTRDSTNEPTVAPTIVPTRDSTDEPTVSPTLASTGEPTNEPTVAPTIIPTRYPTDGPTEDPTDRPTESPTDGPTEMPTVEPTDGPTDAPTTVAPSETPTKLSTLAPEASSPIFGTLTPTTATVSPTVDPTASLTGLPTAEPTDSPTSGPTDSPTEGPTSLPTNAPTLGPTKSPTAGPTDSPTEEPTDSPTESPTSLLTDSPTLEPTKSPTAEPTDSPTEEPTDLPTVGPTSLPTDGPTVSLMADPTGVPTLEATVSPTTDSPTSLSTASLTDSPTTASPTDAVSPIPSAEVTSSEGGCTDIIFINEFHYQNIRQDLTEFVEVATTKEFSELAGWSLRFYDGDTGNVYKRLDLDGLAAPLPDPNGSGFNFIAYQAYRFNNEIENGPADGIALVDADNNLIEFISYDGTLVGNSGPARDIESVDVGVTEPPDTPRTTSIQRVGTGYRPEDFTWEAGLISTPSLPNTGQTMVCPP